MATDPTATAAPRMPTWVFWTFMAMAFAAGILTALTVQEWL